MNGRTKAPATRRQHGSALPEDVLHAAFEMAQQVSLANLTMPALAKHMGVPLTSIYWHYRKKEQLLDAMVDRAIRDYQFVTPFDDIQTWDDGLFSHFRKMRSVFADNPVLCELVLMRPGMLRPDATHAALTNLEQVIETMVVAGFSAHSALDIYLALSVFSRGTAIVEHLNSQIGGAASINPPGRLRQLDTTAIEQILATRVDATGVATGHTPLLKELAEQGHSVADVNFEFTLAAIIDRARNILAAERGAAATEPNSI